MPSGQRLKLLFRRLAQAKKLFITLCSRVDAHGWQRRTCYKVTMGIIKHVIPRDTRQSIVNAVNEHTQEGIIRNNLANAESVGGFLLVAAGAKIDGKAGLVLRAFGELLDDIDGDTARALGIVSKIGAFLDPVVDKGKMLIELKTLWTHADSFDDQERIKRHLALGVIAGKHAVNASLNTIAFVYGLEPEASSAGKINLWIDGLAIAAFGISDVVESPLKQHQFATIGYAATAVGIPSGVIAATGYARQLINGLRAR